MAREQGVVERNEIWLLAHGYVMCKYAGTACPGPVNDLMHRVCLHLGDCPACVGEVDD